MTRFVFGVAAVFTWLAIVPAQRAARVTIHLAVESQHGEAARGVPAETFSLSVDGVARPIESVGPAGDPLSVILLVDDSLSMNRFGGAPLAAARDFVESLGSADRWRVGSFADRILFSRAFATGRAGFGRAPRDGITVRERTVSGGSPLWDAVHHSVELLAHERGRRTVLVVTDGRASGNHYGLEEVAEFANDNAASLSAIVPLRSFGVRQDEETIAVVSPAASLDRLTRYTGGLLLGGYDFKRNPLELGAAVAARLRAGYALTFVMPELDGRRHRLEVRVATPGLQVRAPMAFRAAVH
jgi:hypothetical protein